MAQMFFHSNSRYRNALARRAASLQSSAAVSGLALMCVMAPALAGAQVLISATNAGSTASAGDSATRR